MISNLNGRIRRYYRSHPKLVIAALVAITAMADLAARMLRITVPVSLKLCLFAMVILYLAGWIVLIMTGKMDEKMKAKGRDKETVVFILAIMFVGYILMFAHEFSKLS